MVLFKCCNCWSNKVKDVLLILVIGCVIVVKGGVIYVV